MIGFINMNDVEGLIKLKSWRQLARFFAPQIIACRLPFREGIITAHRMLFNDEYDDDVRLFPPLHLSSLTLAGSRWATFRDPLRGSLKFGHLSARFASLTTGADTFVKRKWLLCSLASKHVQDRGRARSADLPRSGCRC